MTGDPRNGQADACAGAADARGSTLADGEAAAAPPLATRRGVVRGLLGGMAAFGAAPGAALGHVSCPRVSTARGTRYPLAVALGSGGAHWPAHVGVMRAFEARGRRPDLIVGTSAGAIVGALWAAGLDAAAVESAARRHGLAEALGARWSWWAGGRDERLRDAMRDLLPARPIERWPTAFAAVATDLASGQRVVMDRGDGPSAVAASACMPMVFRPVERDGRRLIDGALVEPVPVRTARALGAARVVGIDIAYRPGDEAVSNRVDIGFQTLHILVNTLIDEQIDEADVPIRLQLHALIRDRDPYSGVLMDTAAKAVEAAWPQIVG